MNDKAIDNILKDAPEVISSAKNDSMKYERMRKGVLSIFDTLKVSVRDYEAVITEQEIAKFIKAENGTFRILYSEISVRLMNMTMEERGMFSTNVETLLSYILETDGAETDTIKIVFKIYDHTQLVMNQIRNVDEMLSPRLDEAKIAMKGEMKEIEREYITILGIFAAIMLAFVGTYTFSTSVLNNLGRASLGSLCVIALLIGIVFYKIISLLFYFLYDINDKERPESMNYNSKIKYALFFIVGLVIGILLCSNKAFVRFFWY